MQNYMKSSGILGMTVEEFFVNPSFDRQRGGLLVFFPSHCTFCAVIHKEVIILMKDSILVLINYFKSAIMMKLHEVIFIVIVISYQRYTVKHRYSLLHCI